MRSVMSHQFSMVPRANIERSQFDRSHGYKTTFDAGYLIPVYCDEVLPGDTFNLKMTMFGRLATPIAPIMDNLHLDSFFFYVPNRLLWENWQKMCGEQENPGDSTDYLTPYLSDTFAEGSLFDYFGIPTQVSDVKISALWSRAYNLIWNEWFRDENLQDSVVVDKDDGPDNQADYVLLKRGKRHDYFTSCLPWPQKGDDVYVPLGTSAPITGIGTVVGSAYSAPSISVRETDIVGAQTYANALLSNDAVNTMAFEQDPDNIGWPNLRADLSSATAATINALRLAFQMQKLFERDARGGTRYTEIVRSHFGVISPDSRLQRPEYLGGGSTPVNIHPVTQSSQTDTTPQGNMSGFGTMAGTNGFVKSFTEHGVLLGLVMLRADLTYQQGINRMWSKEDRFSYYWPSLSHIGEQTVLNKEIFAQGTLADEEVFGYQERYAEYRYKPSQITGKFRSNATGSLDLWHLSQDFATLPVLDSDFIEENPPIARVVATPDEPDVLFDSYFSIKTARPMPMYAVPGLIDHM